MDTVKVIIEGELDNSPNHGPNDSNGESLCLVLRTNDLNAEFEKHHLTHLDREATVVDASKLMREAGSKQLLVTEKINGDLQVIGVVSSDDIVTGIVAAELDPAVMTIGDLTWTGTAARPISGDRRQSSRSSAVESGASTL
jgi:hypothetical protein